jgi:hypothetical protein
VRDLLGVTLIVVVNVGVTVGLGVTDVPGVTEGVGAGVRDTCKGIIETEFLMSRNSAIPATLTLKVA